jgi:hypothetical protein
MRPAVFASLVVAVLVVTVGQAQAKPPESWQRIQIKPNPYDGWTLEQIKAESRLADKLYSTLNTISLLGEAVAEELP